MESKRTTPTERISKKSPTKNSHTVSNTNVRAGAQPVSSASEKKLKNDTVVGTKSLVDKKEKVPSKSKVTALKQPQKKAITNKHPVKQNLKTKSTTTDISEKKQVTKKPVAQSKATKAKVDFKKTVSAKIKKITPITKKQGSKHTLSTKKSKSDHHSVEMIQSAIKTALTNYSNYHVKSTSKHKSNAHGSHGTGYSSFFNHSKKCLEGANALAEAINEPKIPFEVAIHTIRRFLDNSSTAFHHHSFASYLADALSEYGIVHHHGSNHYSQEAVIRELKKWISENVQSNQYAMNR